VGTTWAAGVAAGLVVVDGWEAGSGALPDWANALPMMPDMTLNKSESRPRPNRRPQAPAYFLFIHVSIIVGLEGRFRPAVTVPFVLLTALLD
jgi:hypothetical protein